LLEGSVVDQHGKSVQDSVIWLQRTNLDGPKFFQKNTGEVVLETKTDSDGRFSFPDVSPGKWWIGPAPQRDDWDAADPEAIAAVAQPVEVLEGSPRQEVLVRVHRGLYIRGRLLDPAGEPAPDTDVMAKMEGVHGLLLVNVASDATFALGPLVPGRYSLIGGGWDHADSAWVEATAGDENVVLRLRAGGSLRGTTLDGATGQGCASRLVCSAKGAVVITADEDGTFQIGNLLPGTYHLVATASGQRIGVLRDIAVQPGSGTDGLIVTLMPGALLRLKHAGKEASLRYQIRSNGALVAWGGLRPAGSFETAVPPGRLSVETRWGDSTEQAEIDLAVGEEKELVLGRDP
jgi:hypothetical protein